MNFTIQKESGKAKDKKASKQEKTKKTAPSTSPAPSASTSSPAGPLADPEEWAVLYTQVATQGDLVRRLKADNAPKVRIGFLARVLYV